VGFGGRTGEEGGVGDKRGADVVNKRRWESFCVGCNLKVGKSGE